MLKRWVRLTHLNLWVLRPQLQLILFPKIYMLKLLRSSGSGHKGRWLDWHCEERRCLVLHKLLMLALSSLAATPAATFIKQALSTVLSVCLFCFFTRSIIFRLFSGFVLCNLVSIVLVINCVARA